MNNKLKNIQMANILLEQKYLREQAETKTGTTITTGVTQTTGSTQTPPSNQQSQPSKPNLITLSEPQKKELEKKVKDNALMKCVGKPQFVVKIGEKNIHSNDNGKTFCIG
jgi:hypothetical protein